MSTSLRIVVADDEPDMREYFQRLLPRLGHHVAAAAANGRELVDHCRVHLPDLVITDIRMPDMDGIDAEVQIYREHPVPVILVSAFHDVELIERAEADHILAYLVKPIKQVDLELAIVLARRRFEEFEALRQEAADLRQALADRKVIERAKGQLMRHSGLAEAEAFRRMQKLANERRIKLVELAQLLLQNAPLGID